jgi:trehalose 6-phosphate synthase
MTPDQTDTSGGLAIALRELLSHRDGVWAGWSGNISDETDIDFRRGSFTSATIDMTNEEHEGAYLGYANSVLWPVFHNRLDLARFDRNFFGSYAAYNARMADMVAALVQPGDVIWVHDYHFMILGRFLRERGITQPVGFFLHIPMPPQEAFLAIPEFRDLATSMAAYDLVGFQTTQDVGNTLSCLRAAAGAELLPSGRLSIAGESVQAGSFPISIDASYFAPSGSVTSLAPSARYSGLKRVLGVDRLDYTKGLPQKFRGFAHLLKTYPHFRKHAVLTQIAAPTRESVEVYADIRQELEGISGAINGEFGDVDWMPVHYIHRSVPRKRLKTLYRSAAVGFVTPLRDGMNLTAKEYVASQDPADPGVLILSRFAGAAEELQDALLVNPYCVEEMGDTLAKALAMPIEERRQRHALLQAVISRRDTTVWASDFLAQLERSAARVRSPFVASPAA